MGQKKRTHVNLVGSTAAGMAKSVGRKRKLASKSRSRKGGKVGKYGGRGTNRATK